MFPPSRFKERVSYFVITNSGLLKYFFNIAVALSKSEESVSRSSVLVLVLVFVLSL